MDFLKPTIKTNFAVSVEQAIEDYAMMVESSQNSWTFVDADFYQSPSTETETLARLDAALADAAKLQEFLSGSYMTEASNRVAALGQLEGLAASYTSLCRFVYPDVSPQTCDVMLAVADHVPINKALLLDGTTFKSKLQLLRREILSSADVVAKTSYYEACLLGDELLTK